MAELEAVYDNRAEGHRYGWRYPLVPNKPVRLGRVPAEADWTMNDPLMSGFHATLMWDGVGLSVRERNDPKPPKNRVYFRGQPEKEFAVPPGESFVIGHTKFTVHPASGQTTHPPAEGTLVQREQVLPRGSLTIGTVANPAAVLRALERVPDLLRVSSDEGLLYREMLRVLLDALPRADAAGVVFVPTDTPAGELRVGVRDHQQRLAAGADLFHPSRRLVDKAIRVVRQSCLHVWHGADTPSGIGPPGGAAGEMTLAPTAKFGGTPWAVCTPFQDGSGLGLYVSGRLPPGRVGKDRPTDAELTESQKVAELVVSLLESSRRTLRLEQQNTLIKKAWPRRAQDLLDDPERVERLLEPRDMEVTVLFCDLRDSVGLVDAGAGDSDSLLSAWPRVATALDEMSRTITDNEGVVAGFQGDAVMGFWGWPETQPDQVELAAKAALRMYDRLTNWHKFKCGLGLAHGRAVAGRLGAHDLAKVDVFGPTVNLASRLEGLTKAFGVGVLVNDAVAEHLSRADARGSRYRLRKMAKIRPKGFRSANLVLELTAGGGVGSSAAAEHRRRAWEEAVDWVHNREWERAYIRLESLFRDDPAAKRLMAFMDLTNRVAPEGWDGGITFTEKS